MPTPPERATAARAGFDAAFVRRVDPDGTLDPEERARRVEQARSEHFARLAAASAETRRRSRDAGTLTAAQTAKYVARLVEAAPPLTPAQRDRLAVLLRPVRQ